MQYDNPSVCFVFLIIISPLTSYLLGLLPPERLGPGSRHSSPRLQSHYRLPSSLKLSPYHLTAAPCPPVHLAHLHCPAAGRANSHLPRHEAQAGRPHRLHKQASPRNRSRRGRFLRYGWQSARRKTLDRRRKIKALQLANGPGPGRSLECPPCNQKFMFARGNICSSFLFPLPLTL